MEIEFSNVSKNYRDTGKSALHEINLQIKQGEFVYVIGESGSGKSTIINLLYHKFVPSSGQIKVSDYEVEGLKSKEIPFYRRHLGMVFQDFKLLSDKTVYENVAYAMQVVEANPDLIERRVIEVLSMVGLKPKLDYYPKDLSGGEQQRVAVARAIVNKPQILLADEPTGNLDPGHANEIMRAFKEINAKENTTIIMATHNDVLVNSDPKRVVAIYKGYLVRDAPDGAQGYSYYPNVDTTKIDADDPAVIQTLIKNFEPLKEGAK